MKVKIFRSNTAADINQLEKDINEFCKNRKVIDIKYSTDTVPISHLSNGVPVKIGFYDSVLILYEEE